jgi:hypothetical protein
MERNGGKQQQQQQPQPPPPPAAAASGKAPWRDGAVTYFHLLFYIAISGGQIFFNKASPPHPSLLSPPALPGSISVRRPPDPASRGEFLPLMRLLIHSRCGRARRVLSGRRAVAGF